MLIGALQEVFTRHAAQGKRSFMEDALKCVDGMGPLLHERNVNAMKGSFAVELAGDMAIVRFRGAATEALLLECHQHLLDVVRNAGRQKILYDAREMTTPDLDLVFLQRHMVEARYLGESLRRAIVVSNTKLAYLARLAFGEGEYEVFYNDMASAIQWLERAPSTSAPPPAH